MLPAHAGMVPVLLRTLRRRPRAPRARGDGPPETHPKPKPTQCSPRTRGWSPGPTSPSSSRWVLPAHAGMVPSTPTPERSSVSAPRARGDGPTASLRSDSSNSCSPRTRGWSQLVILRVFVAEVLPAHAGMVPVMREVTRFRRGAPRARGDGPPRLARVKSLWLCSPRTRGWSLTTCTYQEFQPVLPAHAGMVPRGPWAAGSRGGAPRARGDGPVRSPQYRRNQACSPRTRGWSARGACRWGRGHGADRGFRLPCVGAPGPPEGSSGPLGESAASPHPMIIAVGGWSWIGVRVGAEPVGVFRPGGPAALTVAPVSEGWSAFRSAHHRRPVTRQSLPHPRTGQGCRASRPKQTSQFTTRPTPDDLEKNGP